MTLSWPRWAPLPEYDIDPGDEAGDGFLYCAECEARFSTRTEAIALDPWREDEARICHECLGRQYDRHMARDFARYHSGEGPNSWYQERRS